MTSPATTAPSRPSRPVDLQPGQRRRISRRHREWGLAYLLLLPALVIFGIFTFYPFLKNFKLALYQNPPYPGLPSHYVGLQQVQSVLSSTEFHQSLVSTLVYVVMVVPVGLLGGLLLALAAHRAIRGTSVYRLIFSSTVVTSVAVAAVVFGTLMDPVVGLLPWLGFDPPPRHPGEPDVGTARRRPHRRVAVPRALVHHHDGRTAVIAGRDP